MNNNFFSACSIASSWSHRRRHEMACHEPAFVPNSRFMTAIYGAIRCSGLSDRAVDKRIPWYPSDDPPG
jgi:hypothetical protein